MSSENLGLAILIAVAYFALGVITATVIEANRTPRISLSGRQFFTIGILWWAFWLRGIYRWVVSIPRIFREI